MAIAREKPDALVTLSDGALTLRHQREIVAFTTKHRLPMVSETAEFAEAGALMTYGASLTALFRRAAFYVDQILRGTRPDASQLSSRRSSNSSSISRPPKPWGSRSRRRC